MLAFLERLSNTKKNEINQIKSIPLVANKIVQPKKANFVLLGENIKIAHADCLLALDKMESNSVDCIITDPPYFLDGMESD
jgi:tRNA1(Val) A37 N6-methylase TrmN6